MASAVRRIETLEERWMSDVRDAEAGDIVSIHYVLTDKKTQRVIDSTRARGRVLTFQLQRGFVVPALDIIASTLCAGERAVFDVPHAVAWGDKGLPGLIPPRTDLIIDVEMMDINRE